MRIGITSTDTPVKFQNDQTWIHFLRGFEDSRDQVVKRLITWCVDALKCPWHICDNYGDFITPMECWKQYFGLDYISKCLTV